MAHPKHGRSFGMKVGRWWKSDGYILEMCSGLSLVASYSGPNFSSSLFGGLESLVLSFLFEHTKWSLHGDFKYNSIVHLYVCGRSHSEGKSARGIDY